MICHIVIDIRIATFSLHIGPRVLAKHLHGYSERLHYYHFACCSIACCVSVKVSTILLEDINACVQVNTAWIIFLTWPIHYFISGTVEKLRSPRVIIVVNAQNFDHGCRHVIDALLPQVLQLQYSHRNRGTRNVFSLNHFTINKPLYYHQHTEFILAKWITYFCSWPTVHVASFQLAGQANLSDCMLVLP